MSVLVDTARFPAHGRWWAHLASDSSLAELHAFAAALGVPPGAFEGDHYDVPADLVPAAVARGAVPVSTREVLEALRRSGLRTPKRKGEKVLATVAAEGGRVDVVRAHAVPVPHGEHLLLSTTPAGVVARAVPDLSTGTVLGFARRWWTGPGPVTVRHDGVLATADVLASPAAASGPGAAWWSVLLTAGPP